MSNKVAKVNPETKLIVGALVLCVIALAILLFLPDSVFEPVRKWLEVPST